MTEAGKLKSWIRANIEALISSEWLGRAGEWFRTTVEVVEEFNETHLRLEEKIDEAPDVAWKSLKIKSSQTDLNLAQVEERKIAAELARRTLTAKTRQEEAAAEMAEINVMKAKVELLKTLKEQNVVFTIDSSGTFVFRPAPPGYDWDGLTTFTLTVDNVQSIVKEPMLEFVTKTQPTSEEPPPDSAS